MLEGPGIDGGEAYAEFGVERGVGTAGLLEDGGNHVVEVVVGVGIVEAFGKAVHEDAWIWCFDFDFGIGPIVVCQWEEEISGALVRIVGAERAILTTATMFALVTHHMISDDRMNSYFAEEAAVGFDDTEQQDGDRQTYCCVDTVLDAGKNGHNDTGKEDDNL